MAQPVNYSPAGLIIGLLSTADGPLDETDRALSAAYGPVALRSDPFPFHYTDYYAPEFGETLVKQFRVYDRLIDPSDIKRIKIETNAIEAALADAAGKTSGRVVNIDPGVITPGKLLLASAKDFAGRVPVGNGWYVEVTLFYRHGKWVSLPWTFPDFSSGDYDAFLDTARRWVTQARKTGK